MSILSTIDRRHVDVEHGNVMECIATAVIYAVALYTYYSLFPHPHLRMMMMVNNITYIMQYRMTQSFDGNALPRDASASNTYCECEWRRCDSATVTNIHIHPFNVNGCRARGSGRHRTVIAALFVLAKTTAEGTCRMIDKDVLYDNKTKKSRCSGSGVVVVLQYGSVLSSPETECAQHNTMALVTVIVITDIVG
jgi:hypothetical protein